MLVDLIRTAFFPVKVETGIYQFMDYDPNPFQKVGRLVEVLEVKEGWVSYRFLVGVDRRTIGINQAMKKKQFAFCYRKLEERSK